MLRRLFQGRGKRCVSDDEQAGHIPRIIGRPPQKREAWGKRHEPIRDVCGDSHPIVGWTVSRPGYRLLQKPASHEPDTFHHTKFGHD